MRRLLIYVVMSWVPVWAIAQNILDQPYDTTYYQYYTRSLTTRVIGSAKYTSLVLIGPKSNGNILYRPNIPLDIGIGATYNFLTLDLMAGFGFLNHNSSEVNSHYLDLSSHAYIGKLSIDFYGQFYRGYYLPSTEVSTARGKNYVRPDVNVNLVGMAVYYILNFKKFSYRASIDQYEWQMKSAGSFLIGAEIYYGDIHGDSSLVPFSLQAQYSAEHIRTVHFFDIGPGLGYAYTFVWHKHLFLTGGINLSAALVYSQEFGGAVGDRLGINPNFAYRAVGGYNGRKWSANMAWINDQLTVNGDYAREAFRIKTGFYRLTVNRRFNLKLKTSKKMNQVTDKVLQLVPTIH